MRQECLEQKGRVGMGRNRCRGIGGSQVKARCEGHNML